METMRVRVVGGSHHAMNEQREAGKLKENAPLTLMLEPGNPFDSNAIRVLADSKQIGYVARDMSAHVAALIKDNRVLSTTVLYEPKGEKAAFLLANVEVKALNGSSHEESPDTDPDFDP